jgi:diguanylate cyclase (GGDEF)-like protein/PAS domain S-box-containing protein
MGSTPHDPWNAKSSLIVEPPHASEQALRQLFELSGVGLLQLVPDNGEILRVNQAVCGLLRYEEKELVGRRVRDLLPREHSHFALESDVSWGIRGVKEMEQPFLAKDGRVVWACLTLKLFSASAEQPHFVLATLQDITRQKQLEVEVRSSEERFHLMADAMPQIVWTAQPDGSVDYYNQRWSEYSGITQKQGEGWGWQPVVHPDDEAETVEAWTTAVATGQPYEIEHRIKRADGSFQWHLSRGVPLRDAQGKIVKWFGTATNIHEQKGTEGALRESEERFRSLFTSAPLGVLAVNDRGSIVMTNPTLESLFGYTLGELYGQPLEVLLPERLRHRHALHRQRFSASPHHRAMGTGMDLLGRRKDGSEFPLEASLTSLQLDRETLAVAFIVDISERKRAETHLTILSAASTSLVTSLELTTTLENVAQGLVPQVADWCVINLVADDGTITTATLAHTDPEKVKWAEELQQRYPIDPNGPAGAPRVIRTGQPEFYPEITDVMLQAAVQNEEQLALVRSVGYSSAMVVPLIVREQTIGAVTLVMTESGRHFTGADLTMAEELARRCAAAIDNARLHEKLRLAALYDALTGLPTRTLFMERLTHAIHAHRRNESKTFAVLFMDLDKFKTVNDTLGHAAGDQLLIKVAERLRSSVREGDTPARLAGDEFVVLLEGVQSPPAVNTFTERLLEVLYQPYEINNRLLYMSGSIGVALADLSCEGEEILHRADEAMYEAKKRGTGYAVWTPVL